MEKYIVLKKENLEALNLSFPTQEESSKSQDGNNKRVVDFRFTRLYRIFGDGVLKDSPRKNIANMCAYCGIRLKDFTKIEQLEIIDFCFNSPFIIHTHHLFNPTLTSHYEKYALLYSISIKSNGNKDFIISVIKQFNELNFTTEVKFPELCDFTKAEQCSNHKDCKEWADFISFLDNINKDIPIQLLLNAHMPTVKKLPRVNAELIGHNKAYDAVMSSISSILDNY